MGISKYKIVRNTAQLKKLIRFCKKTRYCSLDFETTGLEYYELKRKPICMGISFQPGSTWIIPLYHKDSPFASKAKVRQVMNRIGRELIQNWDVIKICWNLKFEYKWWLRYGFKMLGRAFDAQLAKYTLDEERPNDLKSWTQKLFPEWGGYEEEVAAVIKRVGGWENMVNCELDEVAKYCGIDCDMTLRLFIYFERRMIKLGFYNLFRNLLMMETRVLAESEFRGMYVDRPYVEQLQIKYKALIDDCSKRMANNKAVIKFEKGLRQYYIDKWISKVELEIKELEQSDEKNTETKIKNRLQKIANYRAGIYTKKESDTLAEGINWRSVPQVSQFFFTSKFGLKLKPFKFTDTGNPSTDEESIEHLKHKDKSGIMDLLLEMRGLNHIYSTFIEGPLSRMSSDNKMHPNYKVFGTVTGRLSCENPNFQQIPRKETNPDIKRMFVPPPGYVMLEVDYSQAELRVVAEIAKDVAMIDIFKRNFNIHMATACLVNGGLELYDEAKNAEKDEKHPKHDFWVRQKKRAKTINFGILYQMGADKLALELGIPTEEAQDFINRWFEAYPQVSKWIKDQKKFAKKHGWVINLFHRKRRLYNIDSDNYGQMLEAERQSVNAPIQGTASDFTSFSQVVIREKIMKGELPPDLMQCYTVHDSIGFYIKPKDVHSVVPKLIEICDNPETLKYFGFQLEHVKMKVAVEVGSNWLDKHDYNPWENYEKLVRPA